MISSDLVRAALVVIAAGVIFSDGPALLVYGLAIVTSLAGTPFRPSQAALLPKLARDSGELTAANVASSTIESVGFFIGPALGGLLLAFAEIPVVYLFNAATFVWSAALVLRIRPVAAPPSGEDAADETDDARSVGFLRESAAGFSTILRSPDLRALVGLYSAQCVVAGASAVFIVAVALDMLDLGKAGVGCLEATLGTGGLVGGFVALVLAQRGRLAFDFALGVFLSAVPLLLIAAWPTLPGAIVALLLIGLANSLVTVELKAGETAVREGDEGDRFYVVESWTLSVSKVGEQIAELGPGESFGEIALLRDVPRTATVTAATDVVLLALDRRRFIPAVTGHGDAHEAAELVISSRMGMR